MSDKKSVTVRIAGEEHVIRASAPPEYTRACAQLVDDRIMESRAKAGLLEAHKAAILAARDPEWDTPYPTHPPLTRS